MILFSENTPEIGRIVESYRAIYLKHDIVFNSKKYPIKYVGFLWNDSELTDAQQIIYRTDFAKNRIFKTGADFKYYTFKLGKISQLFDGNKLIIEIIRKEKWFKNPTFDIEADNSIDELLILFFLYYSTREFGSIG